MGSRGKKIKGDGRAIASLERGVHDLKKRVLHMSRSSQPHIKAVDHLLTTKDFQEIAWKSYVFNPFGAAAARMPVSAVNGFIPVDKWSVPHTEAGHVNASGYGCAMMGADGFYGEKILGPNGSTGVNFITTASTYVGISTPTAGATANIGIHMLPDVSANFTADATSGTEYINVASGLGVSLKSAGNSPPTWGGDIYIVTTTDPYRSTLHGKSLADFRTLAAENGSAYTLEQFKISQSGLFLPAMSLSQGNFPASYADEGGYGALAVPILPLTHTAFEWQLVSAARNTALSYASVAIFYQGLPTTGGLEVFAIRGYQTERYPSMRADSAPRSSFHIQHSPGGLMATIMNMASNVPSYFAGSGSMLNGSSSSNKVSPAAIIDTLHNGKHTIPGFYQKIKSGGLSFLKSLFSSQIPNAILQNLLKPPTQSYEHPLSSGPWGWVEEIEEGAGEALPYLEEGAVDLGELALLAL
jgi:hypothetical protein